MSSKKRTARAETFPPAGEQDRGPLLGAMLRLTHQAMLNTMFASLSRTRSVDVLPAQIAALLPLYGAPEGLRATEIAAAARITKQSMGTLVDQLEERGYVERVDDPEDRRAKRVRLTSRGRRLGRDMRAAVRYVEEDWARRIGVDRLAALRSTLSELLASLDAE
jgi:DNA-binding MarR family transcriptional regulator